MKFINKAALAVLSLNLLVVPVTQCGLFSFWSKSENSVEMGPSIPVIEKDLAKEALKKALQGTSIEAIEKAFESYKVFAKICDQGNLGTWEYMVNNRISNIETESERAYDNRAKRLLANRCRDLVHVPQKQTSFVSRHFGKIATATVATAFTVVGVGTYFADKNYYGGKGLNTISNKTGELKDCIKALWAGRFMPSAEIAPVAEIAPAVEAPVAKNSEAPVVKNSVLDLMRAMTTSWWQ